MNYKEKANLAIEYFTSHKLVPEPVTIKAIQQYLKVTTIDGYWGPLTDYAYDSFIEKSKTGVKFFRNDANNPYKHIKSKYPSYISIESFYGSLSDIPNRVETFTVPYAHKLAWNTSRKVNKVTCHKLVKEPYLKVLEKVLTIYGEKELKRLRLDLFGGAYYYPPRKMKGGSLISTHSYGVAFDYDPENNQLKWGRDKASFANPDYSDWLDAWNTEGAFSLGEIKNYDWMHFQFVKP